MIKNLNILLRDWQVLNPAGNLAVLPYDRTLQVGSFAMFSVHKLQAVFPYFDWLIYSLFLFR